MEIRYQEKPPEFYLITDPENPWIDRTLKWSEIPGLESLSIMQNQCQCPLYLVGKRVSLYPCFTNSFSLI